MYYERASYTVKGTFRYNAGFIFESSITKLPLKLKTSAWGGGAGRRKLGVCVGGGEGGGGGGIYTLPMVSKARSSLVTQAQGACAPVRTAAT